MYLGRLFSRQSCSPVRSNGCSQLSKTMIIAIKDFTMDEWLKPDFKIVWGLVASIVLYRTWSVISGLKVSPIELVQTLFIPNFFQLNKIGRAHV